MSNQQPGPDDLAEFEAEFGPRGDTNDGDPETGTTPTGGLSGLGALLEEPSTALFAGDTSRLTYEQRHTLNLLLKNPFLAAAAHPTPWRTLLADPGTIRSRLHDLFFDLEIDREREVALKRPVANPTGDRFPTLVYDSRLSREETVVVICLRRHYRTERGTGADRVFIDASDIHEFAETLRPATATDVTGDRRRVNLAIDAVRKSGLLAKTREEDRYEVSSAIELLLPMSKLEAVLVDLRTQNGTSTDQPTTSDPNTDPGADQASGPEDAAENQP